jgi:hypothetical protein
MADIGLYNYAKAALARGESREAIIQTLLKGGSSQEKIDEVFVAIDSGVVPQSPISNGAPVNSPATAFSNSSQQQTWDAFSRMFWKFAGVAIALSVFKHLLPVFHFNLGPFGLLFTFVGLMLGVCIMVLVARMTTEIRGSRSTGLVVLTLFLPFLVYYLVYRLAKNNEWKIELSILSKAAIIIYFAYYLCLIVLTVLLFTVSLRAAPLLGEIGGPTVAVDGHPITSSTASSIAQMQQQDSYIEVKSALASIQTHAQQYYERNGHTFGPAVATSTACDTGVFADPAIVDRFASIRNNVENVSVECGIRKKAASEARGLCRYVTCLHRTFSPKRNGRKLASSKEYGPPLKGMASCTSHSCCSNTIRSSLNGRP